MLCADAFTKMKVGMDQLKGASSSYLREMFGLVIASFSLFFASLDFVTHQTGARPVHASRTPRAACSPTQQRLQPHVQPCVHRLPPYVPQAAAPRAPGAYGVSLGVVSAAITLASTYLVDTKRLGTPTLNTSHELRAPTRPCTPLHAFTCPYTPLHAPYTPLHAPYPPLHALACRYIPLHTPVCPCTPLHALARPCTPLHARTGPHMPAQARPSGRLSRPYC